MNGNTTPIAALVEFALDPVETADLPWWKHDLSKSSWEFALEHIHIKLHKASSVGDTSETLETSF